MKALQNMAPELLKKLEALFPQEEFSAAAALLEMECGRNLPFAETLGIEGIERVRCAVLKLSEGSIEKLRHEVLAANFDWRDVLVAAGFANDPKVNYSG